MLRIKTPESEAEFDSVRQLMRAFIAWHRLRHHDQIQLVESYFDSAAFDAELVALPEKYQEPDGALLLATFNEQPAGCVALRRIDSTSCEMKRRFVDPSFQGKGVGRALGQAIVDKAKSQGYQRVLLDSGAKQFEAHALYRSLGFTDTAPYYTLPPDLRDWLVYMELSL